MEDAAISMSDLRFAWPGCESLIAIERLEIGRGERVFLRGASGSGKSTLLGLVGGVLSAQRGSIRVLGTELGALSASERDRFRGDHVGFIFQMFNLIPYLTVRANVLLPLRFSRARRERIERLSASAGARGRADDAGGRGVGRAADAEALRLLAAVGLAGRDLLDRSVLELSVGQQQRVAAARALIGRPELVIADEPTSALDADARTAFLELLMSECRSLGTTLLFVSHDAALGSRFDRVLAMADVNRPVPATVAAPESYAAGAS